MTRTMKRRMRKSKRIFATFIAMLVVATYSVMPSMIFASTAGDEGGSTVSTESTNSVDNSTGESAGTTGESTGTTSESTGTTGEGTGTTGEGTGTAGESAGTTGEGTGTAGEGAGSGNGTGVQEPPSTPVVSAPPQTPNVNEAMNNVLNMVAPMALETKDYNIVFYDAKSYDSKNWSNSGGLNDLDNMLNNSAWLLKSEEYQISNTFMFSDWATSDLENGVWESLLKESSLETWTVGTPFYLSTQQHQSTIFVPCTKQVSHNVIYWNVAKDYDKLVIKTYTDSSLTIPTYSEIFPKENPDHFAYWYGQNNTTYNPSDRLTLSDPSMELQSEKTNCYYQVVFFDVDVKGNTEYKKYTPEQLLNINPITNWYDSSSMYTADNDHYTIDRIKNVFKYDYNLTWGADWIKTLAAYSADKGIVSNPTALENYTAVGEEVRVYIKDQKDHNRDCPHMLFIPCTKGTTTPPGPTVPEDNTYIVEYKNAAGHIATRGAFKLDEKHTLENYAAVFKDASDAEAFEGWQNPNNSSVTLSPSTEMEAGSNNDNWDRVVRYNAVYKNQSKYTFTVEFRTTSGALVGENLGTFEAATLSAISKDLVTEKRGAGWDTAWIAGYNITHTSQYKLTGETKVDSTDGSNVLVIYCDVDNTTGGGTTDPGTTNPGTTPPNPPTTDGGNNGNGGGGGRDPNTPNTNIPDEEIPAGAVAAPEVQITDDQVPAGPILDEITVIDNDVPAGALPQTGGISSDMFMGAGAAFLLIGAILRKTNKRA